MKLRDGFITYTADGEQIMVAAGAAAQAFHGMVRSNSTAAFLVDCLKQDTTLEELVARMADKYDAPLDVIRRDVEKVVATLEQIGALDA